MKKIRYLFEGCALFVLFTLFRFMPVDMASAIGGFLGRTIGPRLAASRKALRQIQQTLPDANHEAILTGMWDNLGRIFAEYPHLRYLAQNRVSVHNDEIIKHALEGEKSAVFISAHFGNWELPSAVIRTRYHEHVNITYRAPNNPISDWLLMKARTLGGDIKAHSKSRKGGISAMQALRDKELLGILIDQKYNQGIEVDFFGRPAMTNPVFVQLAQKFDVPLIPLYCRRTHGAHFEITLETPLETSGELTDIMNAAHGCMERWITQTPEQWLWLHRRWKED